MCCALGYFWGLSHDCIYKNVGDRDWIDLEMLLCLSIHSGFLWLPSPFYLFYFVNIWFGNLKGCFRITWRDAWAGFFSRFFKRFTGIKWWLMRSFRLWHRWADSPRFLRDSLDCQQFLNHLPAIAFSIFSPFRHASESCVSCRCRRRWLAT